jgi:hypothetical protein
VNKVTACSDAATALPGSTLRVSTTPSAGATDRGLRQVDLVGGQRRLRVATPARALAFVGDGARQRGAGCRARSEGTLPPTGAPLPRARQVGRLRLDVARSARPWRCAAASAAPATQDLVAQLGGVELDQHLALA